MTARTASSAVTSAAATPISSCTCALSAFIFGRSSRIVALPSATSTRTNSPTQHTSTPRTHRGTRGPLNVHCHGFPVSLRVGAAAAGPSGAAGRGDGGDRTERGAGGRGAGRRAGGGGQRRGRGGRGRGGPGGAGESAAGRGGGAGSGQTGRA